MGATRRRRGSGSGSGSGGRNRRRRTYRRVYRGGSAELLDAVGKYNNARGVKALLDAGAADVNYQDPRTGMTALIRAVNEAYNEYVALLLDKPGIDVNLRMNERIDYDSALTSAVRTENKEAAKMLLDMPATDVNIRAADGLTPLMIACDIERSRPTLIEYLLARPDVNVNLQDDLGWTALMHAVASRYMDAIKLLLAVPALDRSIRNGAGKTAVEMAREYGFNRVAQMIERGGQKKEMGVRELPLNARNEIYGVPISHGDIMANFHGRRGYESEYGRYYMKEGYDKMMAQLKNHHPLTREKISPGKTVIYSAEIRKHIPVIASNAVTGEAIRDGNILANFDDEGAAGRYYKKSTFDERIAAEGRNPVTGKNFDPSQTNVQYYKANMNIPVVTYTVEDAPAVSSPPRRPRRAGEVPPRPPQLR